MVDQSDAAQKRRELLKSLILQLHKGSNPDEVRGQITRLLGTVPYGDVVQVEQQLIAEGLPQEEVLSLCDIHSAVLRGQIDLSGMKATPAGHPVHTFVKENEAIARVAKDVHAACEALRKLAPNADWTTQRAELLNLFRTLSDVDKHYRRKENLVFPHLERAGITGPPTVMWGKHNQIRAALKGALDALSQSNDVKAGEAAALADLLFDPAAAAVEDMIVKEEQILFPMCLDVIKEGEWYEVAMQSPEIGFCLYDPQDVWVPKDAEATVQEMLGGRIMLPTGSFTLPELEGMMNTLPVDITFVDAEDTVRYFSAGRERIFDRNRTVLGRKVQLCHPPQSVHIVNKILDDFRSGRQSRAEFWIKMGGKFIYISYYAVRGHDGGYLGTVEMTTDVARYRKLEGERRLLSYESVEA